MKKSTEKKRRRGEKVEESLEAEKWDIGSKEEVEKKSFGGEKGDIKSKMWSPN